MGGHPSSGAKNKVEGIYSIAGEQLLGGLHLSLSTWYMCVACREELFQQQERLRAGLQQEWKK